LVETLRVWLDSACNTAQAARELHVERQSMHHRLHRIFSLCWEIAATQAGWRPSTWPPAWPR
jgi:sugar diacid utilization regulator